MILKGKNIVVFDLEIKKTIEEAGGWGAHNRMGVSVAVAFDFRDMRYRIFLDDNLPEFIDRLNEPGTLISGFNIVDFDNKVLRGSGYPLKPESELLVYDMLLESRMGSLGKPRCAVPGFKLDDHLQVLNLPMKTANGAMAPIWYKEGKLGKVIDYCVNDTMQETGLFVHIWNTGTLACQHQRMAYKVKAPQMFFLPGESMATTLLRESETKKESLRTESDQAVPVEVPLRSEGSFDRVLETVKETVDLTLSQRIAHDLQGSQSSNV